MQGGECKEEKNLKTLSFVSSYKQEDIECTPQK